jgi:hypothetical protein
MKPSQDYELILLNMTSFPLAPHNMDHGQAKVYDMLIKVNLGTKNEPKPIFISTCIL